MKPGDRVIAKAGGRDSSGHFKGQEGTLSTVYAKGSRDEHWHVLFGAASWHIYSCDLELVKLEPEPYEAWFV